MMSYDVWLRRIIEAAKEIASRDFQEQTWSQGAKAASSPEEVYQVLMEDLTPDLFFRTFASKFSDSQLQRWNEFRSLLQQYYERMPLHPEPRCVLDDPEWDAVRQAAEAFVEAFSGSPEAERNLNQGTQNRERTR